MTQISTTSVPKPDSIAFGELAFAAGLAGRPVAELMIHSGRADQKNDA